MQRERYTIFQILIFDAAKISRVDSETEEPACVRRPRNALNVIVITGGGSYLDSTRSTSRRPIVRSIDALLPWF
jgi:hypothetical protein